MFTTAYKKTMKNEGGYSNHPDDNGGETYKGIARKYHWDWEGWAIIDRSADFRDSPALEMQVQKFYKKHYWDALNLDSCPEHICVEMFDMSIHFGKKKASQLLQRALNLLNRDEKNINDLTVDGKIGFKTLAVVDIYNKELLLKIIKLLKAKIYIDIVEKNTTQEVFFRGWINRIDLN